MNKKKNDALEIICQNVLEQGRDPESSLAEFPQYADELRPLLQAAIDAKEAVPVVVSDEIMRRNRARLLQHAAQMREAASAPRQRASLDFRRVFVPLALALAFFIGGTTGLVRASTSALPGDGLYAVKRGWESARFWFSDSVETARLETIYENERREEVQKLLGYGRFAAVQFEGQVITRDGNKWNVAGVPVTTSADTDIDPSIQIGTDVIVSGETSDDGTVLATSIILSFSEDILITPTATMNESVETEDVPNSEDVDDPVVTLTPEEEPDETGDGEDVTESESEDGQDTVTSTDDGEEEHDKSDDSDPAIVPTPVPDDGGDSDDGTTTPTPASDGDSESGEELDSESDDD